MKKFVLALMLASSAPVFADAGVSVVIDTLDGGTEAFDGGTGLVEVGEVIVRVPLVKQSPDAGTLGKIDDPHEFFKIVVHSVESGDWLTAAAALLVGIVAFVRTYGKKVHGLLPEKSVPWKLLYFLLETKPGGTLLNGATAACSGIALTLLAGEAVTWTLLKPIVLVSMTGAAMWGWTKDFLEWIKQKKVPPKKETT